MDLNTLAGILLLMLVFSIVFFLFRGWFVDKTNTTKKQRIHQTKKIDTFTDKIKFLEKPVTEPISEKIDTPVYSSQKERDLYSLFYSGIPDEYDIDGNLIKGIEPDFRKAIGYLNIVINSPDSTDEDHINLAKVYHYGMHKFERDLDTAEKIYLDLKFKTTKQETVNIINEAIADINKIKVREWLNLPEPTPPVVAPQLPEIRERPRRIINEEPRRNAEQRNVVNIHRINIPPPPITNNKEYNDPQNTHNPQVLSTIRLSLSKLKKDTPMTKDIAQTFNEVEGYILSMKDSDKKKDSLKSLHELARNTTPLSSTDMTESQALNLVWNRISTYDPEMQNTTRENLFNELATMQEHGHTICATGRFTHIIDTINGVDKDVSIKPSYAINEEMLNTASRIRTEMLDSYPEPERKLLEAGTSPTQEEYDTSLKNTIVTKLKDDYVKTGILTDTAFTSEVGKWIDSI